MIDELLDRLTIPCEDNGVRFVRTDRLEAIRDELAGSAYALFGERPLSKIYRHRDFRFDQPLLLASCHIDSIYDRYYTEHTRSEHRGTFDNSACNAALVETMVGGGLHPQALVAFTGNEESASRGADQTIEAIERAGLLGRLEMVVVLDVTEEQFGKHHSTIENTFPGKRRAGALLRFRRKKELREHLAGRLPSSAFVDEEAPDEACQYAEHDLNCFSLCLPCRVLGEDMHDDPGVAILRKAFVGYLGVLKQATHALADDLLARARPQRP